MSQTSCNYPQFCDEHGSTFIQQPEQLPIIVHLQWIFFLTGLCPLCGYPVFHLRNIKYIKTGLLEGLGRRVLKYSPKCLLDIGVKYVKIKVLSSLTILSSPNSSTFSLLPHVIPELHKCSSYCRVFQSKQNPIFFKKLSL